MKYHPECVERRKNNAGFGHVHGKGSDTSFFFFFGNLTKIGS